MLLPWKNFYGTSLYCALFSTPLESIPFPLCWNQFRKGRAVWRLVVRISCTPSSGCCISGEIRLSVWRVFLSSHWERVYRSLIFRHRLSISMSGVCMHTGEKDKMQSFLHARKTACMGEKYSAPVLSATLFPRQLVKAILVLLPLVLSLVLGILFLCHPSSSELVCSTFATCTDTRFFPRCFESFEET